VKHLGHPTDAESIRRRLAGLRPDSARRWGTMTPQEMLCHLADAYACGFGERTLDPADTWFTRSVLKFLALRTPIPWPKGLKTRKQAGPRLAGTRPTEFDADRRRLEQNLDTFIARVQEGKAGVHPLFRTLSMEEWLRWGYLHADHHLRQFGV
jgi:hypothetical protein